MPGNFTRKSTAMGFLETGRAPSPPRSTPPDSHTRTRHNTHTPRPRLSPSSDVLFYYMPACPRTRPGLCCCLHDRWCSVRPQEATIQFSFERHHRTYLFISPFFLPPPPYSPPTLSAQGGERRENLKESGSSGPALGFFYFFHHLFLNSHLNIYIYIENKTCGSPIVPI